MKVRDYIKRLEELDPNALVVCEGHDHSFDGAGIPYQRLAALSDCGHIYDAWKEDQLVHHHDSLIDVVVVGDE